MGHLWHGDAVQSLNRAEKRELPELNEIVDRLLGRLARVMHGRNGSTRLFPSRTGLGEHRRVELRRHFNMHSGSVSQA
jgi:hypothetical protein